jgi:hypothetical protein
MPGGVTGTACEGLPMSIGVPGMSGILGVQVPCTAWWRRSTSDSQGHHREVMSEGSDSKTVTRRTETGYKAVADG